MLKASSVQSASAMRSSFAALAALAAAAYWLFVSPQGPVMNPPPAARFALEEKPGASPKWAFILGGSGGTGFGMAKGLIERGFSVYITGTTQASLDKALEQLRPLAKSKKLEAQGTVTISANVDQNHETLKQLFKEKDVRVVVFLGFPESEAVAPIYNINPSMVRRITELMTRGMTDPLALSLHEWVKKNQTGVFIGFSSNSAYCDLPVIETYTAGRSFQARLLLNAGSFMLGNSKFASPATRKILVANVEVPIVDTNTATRYVEKNPHMKPILNVMAWNPDKYAQQVLHRVFDLGHTNIVEGVGFRLSRMLYKLVPIDFGDPHPDLVNKDALIDPTMRLVYA